MTVDTLLMLLGTFVAILPFLGFPQSWDTVLFFLAGIFIVALGIVVRRRGLLPRERSRNGETPSLSVPVSRHDAQQ